MNAAPSRVMITGAAGYIGASLVRALTTDARFDETRFTLVDAHEPQPGDSHETPAGRIRSVVGDITDPATWDDALSDAPDAVVHLASVLGGAAERDYALARRVNLDASLALLEGLRRQAGRPRFVFASSIAVYGPPLPPSVSDDDLPLPVMTYGAQKLMIETAVQQFSAQNWIDGLALRLPGIVAHPRADSRMKSAFLNAVFFACESGTPFTMPVSADGTSWLISMPACVEALTHAVLLPPERIGARRAFTLPAQSVRMGDLIDALAERYPQSAGLVRFEPDAAIEAQFAAQPALHTQIADALGFRHDGTVRDLVIRAMAAAAH